jgi:hypothetical protein
MERQMNHTTRLAVALAALAAAGVPAAANAAGNGSYVALGDSYTSAPFVSPIASGAPLECGQSAVNYPHLTAAALGLSLTDRSCGGATTSNMTTAQYPDQPPQFSALGSSTQVVTLSIGGNDNALFASAVIACGVTDLADALNIGAPCKSIFGDYFANRATADGPKIGAAINQIHQLAPAATVFVVGYPDILPQSGNCYPQIPLTTGDVAYANGIEQTLNSVLRDEAQANTATYVDTYTPSIGHDACKPEGTRWIEPPIPGTDAAPIHPNAAGEAADATDLEAAMRSAGIN